MPYFIIKAEQAKLGLAFREIKCRKYGEFHNGPLTAEMIAERDEFQRKISELNSIKGFGIRKRQRVADGDISDHDQVN
jgi:hypothetical protein